MPTGRPKGSKNKVRKVVKATTTTNSVDALAGRVNFVLDSLIDQNGRFTVKEATAISRLYGNQLTLAKIKLDMHKLNTQNTTESMEDILVLNK